MSSVSIEGKIQLHIFVKLSRSPEGNLLLSPFSSLSKNCVGLCGNLKNQIAMTLFWSILIQDVQLYNEAVDCLLKITTLNNPNEAQRNGGLYRF